jgi:hypothetical protein
MGRSSVGVRSKGGGLRISHVDPGICFRGESCTYQGSGSEFEKAPRVIGFSRPDSFVSIFVTSPGMVYEST